MSDSNNFSDWLMDLPLKKFLLFLIGVVTTSWIIAMIILLIFLHFSSH